MMQESVKETRVYKCVPVTEATSQLLVKIYQTSSNIKEDSERREGGRKEVGGGKGTSEPPPNLI